MVGERKRAEKERRGRSVHLIPLINVIYNYPCVVVRVTVSVIKHHGPKPLGEERIYSTFHLLVTFHY